eukprot:scaffold19478_cov76-Amphora_coffeaeformis.AAC.1
MDTTAVEPWPWPFGEVSSVKGGGRVAYMYGVSIQIRIDWCRRDPFQPWTVIWSRPCISMPTICG